MPEHGYNVRERKKTERKRNRKMNGAPLFDDIKCQGVPVCAVFQFIGRKALPTHGFARFFESSPRPLEQKFAGQAARNIDQHGPDRQPSQDGVEVDPGMYQYEERSRPSHALMQAQQVRWLARLNQPALTKRIAERTHNEEHTGNAEIAADPDGI